MVDSRSEILGYFANRIKEAREKKLTELDLSVPLGTHENDKLDHIPDAVFELTWLESLDLRNNGLENIPESINQLVNLTKIDLSYNGLESIPESITQFTNLTQLYLSGNGLENIPESINQLTNLTQLYLRNNRLERIPRSITQLTNLTHLYLSGNGLENIPKSINQLTNLTQLDLRNNRLKSIPESITQLTNLTQLNLSDNELKNIPESITQLTNLTHLYLSGNRLENIPKSITQLTNLTQLDLRNNRLKSIPKSITQLTNLTQLNLSDNGLKSIPESITQLTQLTQLYLRNNELKNLPKSVTKLTNLIALDLNNNPIEQPPLEIITDGVQAIRNYFQQLVAGEDYIYEAKLIIVGEGGAGKTTLAKKIDNPDYQLQPDEATTEGIDVITWKFPLTKLEREFQVNIWDFGGQEIYHATHQFFLTKRSLYALVADTRKEDTDFYYWLNVVELLSDNSPVLIIKNEKQDRHRKINLNALRGQFSNLKETLATNLQTNRGLPAIITNIQDYIKKLPHIGQVLPKTWVKVRQALENDPRNHISWLEYLEICEANGFTKLSDKLQLSQYLHDLGVCLHFQDQEDSILYKTVILKPSWGTDAVYKVLDSQQVIQHQGCFTRQDLQNIWHEEKYASMRGELLALMRKFQLCYEIPSCPDTFISPQLLSENQPEYNWDEANNLILRYSYPDFMPKGIISRFIVVMHQSIEQQDYVWKSGVILQQDHTRGEVIENYGKREIRVRVSGHNKRRFMTIITHELDKINDSFNKRLKYQKLIPCNCEKCNSSKEKYFYDFKILNQFINDQQPVIQCQKSYKMVNVLSLIDGVLIRRELDQLSNHDQQHITNIEQNFYGNVDRATGNIARDQNLNNKTMASDRITNNNTNIIKGNYIDHSRRLDISDNAQVDVSSVGAFNLGDISGTVANTINQLPNFTNEPDKHQLKELLSQLQPAIIEAELDAEETEETLEQIKVIAEALSNSQDGTMKKTAKRAMKLLRGTAAALPPSAAMVTICNQLPDLINKIF